MTRRFTDAHIAAWRRDGGVLIERFFTTEEVAAVAADFEHVFGRTEGGPAALDAKRPGQVGRVNQAQFATFEAIPFDCSPALNLIGVHPALIALARATLETDDVYLYQCQAWAKFTGDADYDQPLHCDFSNHTLTVPAENAAENSVTILCYFTDVTEAHGPMHYVTRYALVQHNGRPASASELIALTGRQINGVPNGLTQCASCLGWHGRSLGTEGGFQRRVLRVHCRCENDNRCAYCDAPLANRKLKSYYYDEPTGAICYFPGYWAYAHRCTTAQEGEL